MAQYAGVLRRNPDYSKLWLAQVISLTGDWFNTVVLTTLIALYTNGSGVAVSLFILARFVPPLLISPYAGVLIDRFDRRKLLIASNLLRGMVVPFYLLANSPDTIWIIYVVSIAQSAMAGLFEPAQSAILPSLLRHEDLIIGNTLMSVTWSAMLALGAAVGGLFAARFGITAALIFDALTFLFAAAMTAWLRYTPPPVRRTDIASDGSFREGLRYVRAHPTLGWTLLAKGGTSIGNADTVMAILATQVFVVGVNGTVSLALLYAAFGVGAFFGPMLINHWNDETAQRMRQFILVGFVMSAVSWVFIGLSGSLFMLALAICIRGIGGSINWTFSSVIIQKQVPDAYLGRVFALDYAIFQIASILSTLVHGTLVDTTGLAGIHTILFGTAVAAMIPLLAWTLALPRLNAVQTPELPAVGD